MKYFIFFIFITLSLFLVDVQAQSKPVWLANFEKTISLKEKKWKVNRTLEKFDENYFDYNLTLKSGQYPLAIHIVRYKNVPNIEETFTGLQTAFGNTMGKNASKIRLRNFGDEGYLWSGRGGSFAHLDFRKNDYVVTIFTKSGITAKRFARYILEQMPED